MQNKVSRESLLKKQNSAFCKGSESTKILFYKDIKQSKQYAFKQKYLMAVQSSAFIKKSSASYEWQWTGEVICTIIYSVALIPKTVIYFVSIISIHY